jgi:hypothetical protein
MGKVPEKKTVPVNSCHTLFSLLDCLYLEDGFITSSRNVSMELLLYAAQYLRTAQISHDDLVRQALVWLCMVWFQTTWFGVV